MKRFLLVISALFIAANLWAQDGARIYNERCQACHEGGGASRAPSRELLNAMPSDRIVQALTAGVMREQGQPLSAAERTAVATFLSRVNPTTTAATNRGMCSNPASELRPAADDWNGWGLNAANERFQRNPGFTAADVPNLKLKWAFGFEGDTSAATQPIIVGDRVFVGSGAGRVYSLDLKSGCTYWATKVDSRIRGAFVVGRAGADNALSVFLGDGSATIYRLDATSGQIKWKQKVDQHLAARISGSPVLHESQLIVPVSSSEEANSASPMYQCCTFRGSVVALDAATGKVNWQTFAIADAPAPTGKNSAGTVTYGPSGAGIWHSPTIDASTASIYIATGDAYSKPAAPTTDAVMALDIESGAVKWVKQLTENDVWNMSCGGASPANCPADAGPDHDFGQPPILVSLPNGKRALVLGQKSGRVYALDPDDRGRVLWQAKAAVGGVIGGLEWGSASDGRTFYTPVSDLVFSNPQLWGRGGLDPAKGGGVFAINIADGNVTWQAQPATCSAPPCSPAQPAPPALMPGVLFSGSLDGNLRAYSTTDGKVIWTFNTAQPFQTVNGVTASGGAIDVGGPAIAHGFVVTTSGYGQWGGKPGNVLLAFSAN